MSESVRVVSLQREKLIFSTPLGQPKFQELSIFLFIFILPFLQTFQNNLNHTSTSNIREVIKFYHLGDESFRTDFS